MAKQKYPTEAEKFKERKYKKCNKSYVRQSEMVQRI